MSDRTSFAGLGQKYCFACGKLLDERAEICPNCGVRQTPPSPLPKGTLATPAPISDASPPHRMVAGLLALLFGSFGAHCFYLGKRFRGVLHLLFMPTLVPAVFGFIKGLAYLSIEDDEFAQRVNTSRAHPFAAGAAICFGLFLVFELYTGAIRRHDISAVATQEHSFVEYRPRLSQEMALGYISLSDLSMSVPGDVVAELWDGPAKRAGIQLGDVVFKIDDILIDKYANINAVLDADKSKVISMEVSREGGAKIFDTRLDRVDHTTLAVSGFERGQFISQFRVRILPSSLIHPKAPGFFVTEIDPTGPAAQAGLKIGDIITGLDGTIATKESDLISLLNARQRTGSTNVTLIRNLHYVFVHVPLPNGDVANERAR